MNPFLAPPRVQLRRTWGQRMVLTVNLLLVATSLLLAASLGYGARQAGSVNRVALDRSLTALPPAGGGDRVVNILLVGSDSSANLDPDDPIQIGRQGEQSGDVIIIAHLDERDGSVALLSLPRDLWVTRPGSGTSDRINRSFLLGGPAALIDTIDDNFDIPIHHYVNVDFAGFEGLVDAIGTVPVYFDRPARDWNAGAHPPRSQTGFLVEEAGCHPLEPVQALAYVRSRYYQVQELDGRWVTDPTSDLGRIRRQQDFLRRLVQKAIDRGARNPLVLNDLIDTAISNVAIDGQLTPGLLLDLSGTFRSFDPADLQTYTFPVADATVGTRRVLRPRVAEADALLELFRGRSADDPATVSVGVVHDRSLGRSESLPAPVAEVVDGLVDAGFTGPDGSGPEVTPARDPVAAGIEIRYGPGSRAAAELVARRLPPALTDPVLVEASGLAPRHVVVAVGPQLAIVAGPGVDVPQPGPVPPDPAPPADDSSSPSGAESDGADPAAACR